MNHDQPYWIEPLNGVPCIHTQRGRLCSMEAGYQQTREADARDICARLNALAGLNPDAVAGVVEALEACRQSIRHAAHCKAPKAFPCTCDADALWESSGKALAALRAPRTPQTQTQEITR